VPRAWARPYNLVAQHPDLRKHLFAEEGRARSFVNVYLNDEDIRRVAKDPTPAKETDPIAIVPSVTQGTPEETEGEDSNCRVIEKAGIFIPARHGV